MAIPALGAAWAKEWKRRLDTSPTFATAAAGWSGSLIFAMGLDDHARGKERAVFLAFKDGRCRVARPARPADRAHCDLILTAPFKTWQRLLQGHSDPMAALVFGEIRCERGHWSQLVPYAAAARELLRTAAAIDTLFPTSSAADHRLPPGS